MRTKIDNNSWWSRKQKEKIMRGMSVLNGEFHTDASRDGRRETDRFFSLLSTIPNKRVLSFHTLIAKYLVSEQGQTKYQSLVDEERYPRYAPPMTTMSKLKMSRNSPDMLISFDNSPHLPMSDTRATMVGTLEYYNTSVSSIIEDLFEYFEGSSRDRESQVYAWPYGLESLKCAGNLLVERHDSIKLRITITLLESYQRTGAARVLDTKIEIGELSLNFGMGRCRPDYSYDTQSFLNIHRDDFWMEIGTVDESVIIFRGYPYRSFARAPHVGKMLNDDDRVVGKLPDLVHMVYPDGKFFVDGDKDLRDNPFPKTEDINYFPIYNF